jgi:non-specific serine/threonine protein kinase/serine/threonine-protein kinase
VPSLPEHAPTDGSTAAPAKPTHIGPYRLIRRLGRGGMGTVHLAVRDDDAFEKHVAIKILKRGMDTEAIVRRFRHERQILASLNHPFIAGLLDGGTTLDGLPYFAMEYVEGQPITDYCETRALDTTGRIELFRKVCTAVQYAHQNLIIHRDLKPGNVLVAADGTPKLLDFGIAKLLNPELASPTLAPTVAGLQLMTPEYASPEQVRGETVTTATDIYSLGVLLYEVLTGRRPYNFSSRSPAEIARVVCDAVPERPSTAVTRLPDAGLYDHVETGDDPGSTPTRMLDDTRPRSADTERLRRRLAGDLDTIVLKALSKEPTRRYASVDQFSEDLRRHLAGLPVIARPDTVGYRAAKFFRRNRAAVAAGSLTLFALVAGIVTTAWQAREARAQRVQAERRFEDVRQLANALLFPVHDAIQDLPGSTPARRLLVTEGLAYLDKLSKDAGGRTDLRRELAAAYVKVGDVQGRPLNPNLGDSAGALVSYRKALALYESLRAPTSGRDGAPSREPAVALDPALDRELARAHMRLGELLSATGDTADALSHAQRALAIYERVSAAPSASADLRRELAASYSRVGDLLSASGNVQGALEHRRTALSLMQQLAAAGQGDAATARQLGIAYQKLGQTLGNPNAPNIGDFAGALDALDHAAAVFERAAATHPDSAMFRRLLAVVHSNSADVLGALKREHDALARQQQALAAFRALAEADPTNASAKIDLVISQAKIGLMLDALGRTREGIRESESALAVLEGLGTADPQNESIRADLASNYNQLATMLVRVHDRAGALANHERAVALSRELSRTNPHDIELRVAVALAVAGRGDAYAAFARTPGAPNRRGDLTAAERDYRESVDLFEALQHEGAIAGTDLDSLAANRAALQRVREELAQKK